MNDNRNNKLEMKFFIEKLWRWRKVTCLYREIKNILVYKKNKNEIRKKNWIIQKIGNIFEME